MAGRRRVFPGGRRKRAAGTLAVGDAGVQWRSWLFARDAPGVIGVAAFQLQAQGRGLLDQRGRFGDALRGQAATVADLTMQARALR